MAASPLSLVPLRAQAKRKIILVTANKGGAGKTTTVVHLLTAAARVGYRVLGIDLEPQQNLAKWAARRPKEYAPVPVIAGSMEEYTRALIGTDDRDIVVIDTPPGIKSYMSEIYGLARLADMVVVPTSLDAFDVEVVVPYAEVLHEVTGKVPYFVMNRIDSRIMSSELVETIAHLSSVGKVNALPVPQLIDIGRYMKGGVSVVEFDRKRGQANLIGLWNYVEKEVGLG